MEDGCICGNQMLEFDRPPIVCSAHSHGVSSDVETDPKRPCSHDPSIRGGSASSELTRSLSLLAPSTSDPDWPLLRLCRAVDGANRTTYPNVRFPPISDVR